MLPKQAKPRATVLVVDDSPEMVRYLQSLLELESYRVETASNGLEALRRLTEGSEPDVVLLDLEMPYLDGLRTLKCLRTLRPKLKVIICSGVADPSKRQQATDLGVEVCLEKPVHHLYLTAALERCLEPQPARFSRAATIVPLRPSSLQ
ncbi:MAG TPA: response regulator [Terriglobales bacterium]|nr:response regulator [Terriglobales bacterium]